MEKLKFMTGLTLIVVSLMGAVLVLIASLFGVEFGGISYYMKGQVNYIHNEFLRAALS